MIMSARSSRALVVKQPHQFTRVEGADILMESSGLLPKDIPNAGLPTISQALEATRHLLEMYRRQLSDEKIRRKLQRFEKRLRTVASQLQRMHTEENEARLAS